MKKINIPFSPPDITELEIAEVVDTLRSGWITTGPKTKKFENQLADYCNTGKVATFNSATAAMELTLRLLGVGPGDEVITTAYTYTASASVIRHVGAKIVLVDTGVDSFEFDYEAIGDAITKDTKVIIAVDIAGVMCDYDKILEIVDTKKNLFIPTNEVQNKIGRVIVLADGAHSIGAEYKGKMSGQVADFTAFSFHAVKNLTTGEGGAVTWNPIDGINDEEIYRRYMNLSLHGQSKDALEKSQLGSWEYDIVAPNYKCNMTDIMASLGIVQLSRYKKLLARRFEIIDRYNLHFQGTGIKYLVHQEKDRISSGHLYLTYIDGINEEQRNSIISMMAEAGISTNVHYKPLPMFTAYKDLGFTIEDYPNSYARYKNQITLPLHTLLTNEEVDYIAETLIGIVNERNYV